MTTVSVSRAFSFENESEIKSDQLGSVHVSSENTGAFGSVLKGIKMNSEAKKGAFNIPIKQLESPRHNITNGEDLSISEKSEDGLVQNLVARKLTKKSGDRNNSAN